MPGKKNTRKNNRAVKRTANKDTEQKEKPKRQRTDDTVLIDAAWYQEQANRINKETADMCLEQSRYMIRIWELQEPQVEEVIQMSTRLLETKTTDFESKNVEELIEKCDVVTESLSKYMRLTASALDTHTRILRSSGFEVQADEIIVKKEETVEKCERMIQRLSTILTGFKEHRKKQA